MLICFLMKDKMGVDLEWRNCDKLEGIGIGETIIRIHCMRKKLFPI